MSRSVRLPLRLFLGLPLRLPLGPTRFLFGVLLALPLPPQTARAADFAGQQPSPEVRELAERVLTTGDHGGRTVVIVDKQQARVFVLDAAGRFVGAAPVLLGSARGDHTVPG
ncbi:MAG: hypothetical protein RI884_1565, partial [Pseudomonadota bacterium]